MLRRSLFIFALVSSLLACGQEQKIDTSTEAASIPPAKYPKLMPASTLEDRRLIGYWESNCELSAADSLRWSLLLDPTKAVLEKQVYDDAQCQKAAYTLRYYLTYHVSAKTFEGRIWEVHANIQAPDRLSALFLAQTCPLPSVREDIWYDLTESECRFQDAQASVERGRSLISSSYAMGFNQRHVLIDIPGKAGLKFVRMN